MEPTVSRIREWLTVLPRQVLCRQPCTARSSLHLALQSTGSVAHCRYSPLADLLPSLHHLSEALTVAGSATVCLSCGSHSPSRGSHSLLSAGLSGPYLGSFNSCHLLWQFL